MFGFCSQKLYNFIFAHYALPQKFCGKSSCFHLLCLFCLSPVSVCCAETDTCRMCTGAVYVPQHIITLTESTSIYLRQIFPRLTIKTFSTHRATERKWTKNENKSFRRTASEWVAFNSWPSIIITNGRCVFVCGTSLWRRADSHASTYVRTSSTWMNATTESHRLRIDRDSINIGTQHFGESFIWWTISTTHRNRHTNLPQKRTFHLNCSDFERKSEQFSVIIIKTLSLTTEYSRKSIQCRGWNSGVF